MIRKVFKVSRLNMNKKSLFFILKFIISAVLLWFIILNFELGPAVDRFKDIKYFYILAAVIMFVVLLVNNTARWMIVLRAIHAHLPFRIVIKIYEQHSLFFIKQILFSNK